MNKDKEMLLQQLTELGIDPSSGRKARSDKGVSRGPNSKVRSDAGSHRLSTLGVAKDPLAVYLSVRSRLLNSSASDDTQILPDINDIFMIMTRDNRVINEQHSIIHRSKKIFRTVRHVKGYDIDLEKYRFVAIQSKILEGDIPAHYRPAFNYEIEKYNVSTWLELFCALYHIDSSEALKWSYKTWREHYLIVCDIVLADDFKFNYEYYPGSPEFLPEYAQAAKDLQAEKTLTLISSKAYKDYRARVRDRLYGNELMSIKQELIIADTENKYSMEQLTKMAKEQLDTKRIEAQIEQEMQEWLNDKLIKGDN